MSGKVHYFTEEGLEKVKAELAHMISVERPAISKAIAEARDKGDLSENAEYDAAREAQGLLELKISQLQDIIANARVIDESKINTDQVQLLNKVKIKNLANGAYVTVSKLENMTYPKSNVNDNNMDTVYRVVSASTKPSDITFDLGSEKLVNTMLLVEDAAVEVLSVP